MGSIDVRSRWTTIVVEAAVSDSAYQASDRAGQDDPLVGGSTAALSAWCDRGCRVVERSWKSLIMITTVAVALPAVAVSVTAETAGVGGYLSINVDDLRWLVQRLPTSLLGLTITALVAGLAVFVVSAGWAAGAWVIVEETATGSGASVLAAFRMGFERARSMWLWSLGIGLAVGVGLKLCMLPGVYVGFACSLFGFVALFEPGANPVLRSAALTHGRIGIALTRIVVSFVPYAIYSVVFGLMVNTTFRAAYGIGNLTNTTNDGGIAVLRGMSALIRLALLGPAVAAVLVGLLLTYAELRSLESPVTTADLRAELRPSPGGDKPTG